jgi:hypothetical protein
MRIEEMYLLDVINDNYYGVLFLYIDNFCIPHIQGQTLLSP